MSVLLSSGAMCSRSAPLPDKRPLCGNAGQFYECLNMASLYKLPCIFVVENNLWAIGMNHPRATGPSEGDNAPAIWKKGPAFGMPGVLVDGMDVVKVTHTLFHACPRTAAVLRCRGPGQDCSSGKL